MMYRLIKWLLHKFNYELVDFYELERLKRIERDKLAGARIEGDFHCVGFHDTYHVYSYIDHVMIFIKSFKVHDYGSDEYARACAQELCDKLNEKP